MDRVGPAEVVRLLRADLAAYAAGADRPPRSGLDLALRVLTLQRLQAVALFRLSQALTGRSARLAGLVKSVSTVLTSADMSPTASIGPGLQLFHPSGVVIGPRCTLGAGVRLMGGVVIGHARGGSPVLGDDVFVGSHAVLVGGVRIGDGASIGANTVVSFDVPDAAVVRAPRADVKLTRPDAASDGRVTGDEQGPPPTSDPPGRRT